MDSSQMILPSKPEDIEKINELNDKVEYLETNIALRNKIIKEMNNKENQSN